MAKTNFVVSRPKEERKTDTLMIEQATSNRIGRVRPTAKGSHKF
jgi:hypothetical protein